MIKVDCSELSGATKLALASAISDGLQGSGIALLRGNNIVIDRLSEHELGIAELQSVVKSYFSSRKDASTYRIEGKGDSIVVHSTELIPDQEKKTPSELPSGLVQCPVCGFVTTSQEKYHAHIRMHDIMRGIAR